MKTFLFQGDSITDSGRRHDSDGYSHGYASFVEAILGVKYPGSFNFINRGVAGDRSIDMLARIKRDAINLKPDVLTVLIGMNDVSHEILCGKSGIDAEMYFTYFEMFLTQVMKMCPQTKIIILEPFVLRYTATEDYWEIFKNEVALRAKKARELAEKYSLPFIGLQEDFDALLEKAPVSHWSIDGVHPTPAGHLIIAKKLVDAVEKSCPELLE